MCVMCLKLIEFTYCPNRSKLKCSGKDIICKKIRCPNCVKMIKNTNYRID